MAITEGAETHGGRRRLALLLAVGLVVVAAGAVWRVVATGAVSQWQAARMSDAALELAAGQPHAPAAVLMERGKRLESNGRFVDAERCYASAVQVAPERADAWIGFGRTAVAARDWARANETLAKAVEQWPDKADAHFTYASILAGTLRTKRAIEQLKLGIARDPARGAALETLGDLQMSAGDAAGAAESYERARKLMPNEKGLRSRLGAALVTAGQAAKARPELEAALKDDPADNTARFFMGKALAQSKDDQDRARAFRELNRVIGFSTNKNGVYVEAARLWLAEGDRPNAVQSLEHAYDLNPYNVDTLTLLTQAYTEDGRPLEAARYQKELETAKALADERTKVKAKIEADADPAPDLVALGQVDLRAHNTAEARAAFDAAALLEPGNRAALEALKAMEKEARAAAGGRP
ncbi:MAG TPA: tetratricopeptide repeat protein [Chthonomonadaceae bacterium]|nr:tetratricopeptide repeat protein [Chthonomonadaceae bacterium]